MLKINKIDVSKLDNFIRDKKTTSSIVEDNKIVNKIQVFVSNSFADVLDLKDENGKPVFQVIPNSTPEIIFGTRWHILNEAYNRRFNFGGKANEKEGLKETPRKALGKIQKVNVDLEKFFK